MNGSDATITDLLFASMTASYLELARDASRITDLVSVSIADIEVSLARLDAAVAALNTTSAACDTTTARYNSATERFNNATGAATVAIELPAGSLFMAFCVCSLAIGVLITTIDIAVELFCRRVLKGSTARAQP